MWLGAWRNKTDTPYNFKWPQEPFQALGIFFSYKSDAANNFNVRVKILKLRNTLKNWKRKKEAYPSSQNQKSENSRFVEDNL